MLLITYEFFVEFPYYIRRLQHDTGLISGGNGIMAARKEQEVLILEKEFEGTQSIEDVFVMFLTVKEDGDFDGQD